MTAEKKAKADLDKEKKKTAKLTKDNKALKAQVGGKKKKTAAGQTVEDSGEIARMKEELDKADQEVKRLTKDVSLKDRRLQDMEKQLQKKDRELEIQAGKAASKDQNLKDAVTELSELKSRIHTGAVTLNEVATTPNEGMLALQKENEALKKENANLKNKMKDLAAGSKTNAAPKDPYAGMRNSDVNDAIGNHVKRFLSRSVVFMQTPEHEEDAINMVWEALKEPQQLETHHNLTKDEFALYYGPKLRDYVHQRRSDLQGGCHEKSSKR